MQRGRSERVLGTTTTFVKQVAQPEIHVLPLPKEAFYFPSVLLDASYQGRRDEVGALIHVVIDVRHVFTT